MRNIFVCDLCGRTITESSWEHEATPMRFNTYCPSRNPMGDLGGGYQGNTFSKPDVCRDCHHEINDALATAIKARLGLNAAVSGGVGRECWTRRLGRKSSQ